MGHTENEMKRVLEQELKVSNKVDERLQETYSQIRKEGKSRTMTAKKSWRKITAAAAVMALTVTATAGTAAAAYLSENTDFLQGLFGNSTKQSVDTKEVLADPDKNDGLTVTMPAKEYVPVDEEKADSLLGDAVVNQQMTKTIGSHTVTIENLVTDGNVVLMYYSMEREGGVTALHADEDTNRTKGAYYTDDADFYMLMQDQDGNPISGSTYMDFEKSTDEKYYLYDYLVVQGEARDKLSPQIEITQYPMTRGEMSALNQEDTEAWEKLNEQTSTEIWKLPEMKTVESRSLEQDGTWICSYSPISVDVNMAAFTEDENAAQDPYIIQNVTIAYKDGSTYEVKKEDLDNTGYVCGVGTELKMAFNRIIDPDEVSKIIINDQEFAVQ